MKNQSLLLLLLSFIAFFISYGFLQLGYPVLKTNNILEISIFFTLMGLVMVVISRWWGSRLKNSLTPVKGIEDIRHQLATFKVQDQKGIHFSASDNPSISSIQRYLTDITTKLQQYYQANKEFTQNASHELQTPLAIIKGNIDLLLQSPRLEEMEIDRLGAILQNTNKLSKLSGALVLLSKIENRPFPDETKVNINKLTEEILYYFNDLIQLQELKVQFIQQENIHFLMSSSMAEILLANLVQNAIRHNANEGQIEIQTKPGGCWQISNTGLPLRVPTEQLFKRFERQSELEEGLGLGLSIVQSICERYEIKIAYHNDQNRHTVMLFF